MSNINAEMAEFAKNLWNNYIKPNAKEEFNGTLSFYRASVTANTQDGYLTVQQPFDTEVTVRCTAPLNDAQVGDVVTVVCFGKNIPNNQIAFLLGSNTNLENYIAEYACTVEQTGDLVTFNDPYGDLPLCSVTANFKVIQDLSHGEPSPTNICPLTGWTEVSVTRAGENQSNPSVYTITWADVTTAIYGGELNVTTGVLTRTYRYYSFDGTETWNTIGSGSAAFYYRNVGTSSNAPSQQNPPRACSHFPNEDGDIASATAFGFSVFRQSSTNTRLRFKPDLTAIPDVDAWKQYLATQYANGTPVQCVYELREDLQQIYQLTPTEIRTLLGENNIWTDANEATSVSYITGHNGLMSMSDKYKLDHIEHYVSEGTVKSVAIEATSPIAVNTTDPITISGTRVLSHENSGVTAGSKGDTTNQTPTFGGTFKALSGTVNATGHLTAFAEHTVTIPNSEASTTTAGLMSASDKTKLNGIDPDDYAKYGDSVSATGTAANNTTGITVATTIPATTSIQGVSGSVTASKVDSGSNGTAPTLGTPISIPNITGVGTLPTATYNATTKKITFASGTLPTLGTDFSVPNVTNVGTASTWAFSGVTVPKAATAIYVPSRASSGNINGSSTVTDNGHTHTVSVTGTIDTP